MTDKQELRVAHDADAVEHDADAWRVEHDSMGEVRVPASALWRAQTQRAVENFPLSGLTIDRRLIAALGAIKRAAARANADLGVLDPDIAAAFADAAGEVAE